MSELTLTEKLIKVQSELKAPKGQYNSFSKFNYRSAEDILEAVKPLNAKYGLLLTLSDVPVLIGEWYYLKATAKITDGESDLLITAFARESENKKGMDHSQITGSASSYARKYALNGLYLIDDTKDADTDQYQRQQNAPTYDPNNNQGANKSRSDSSSRKATEAQMKFLNNLIKGKVTEKFNEQQVIGLLKQRIEVTKDMDDWSPAEASKAIKFLQGDGK